MISRSLIYRRRLSVSSRTSPETITVSTSFSFAGAAEVRRMIALILALTSRILKGFVI